MTIFTNLGYVSNAKIKEDNKKQRGIKKAITFDYSPSRVGLMRPTESNSFKMCSLEFKSECYAEIGDWSLVMVENEIDKVIKQNNLLKEKLANQKEATKKYKLKFHESSERHKAYRKHSVKISELENILTYSADAEQVAEKLENILDLRT